MRAYAIHFTSQWADEGRSHFNGVEGFHTDGLFFERRYPKGEEPEVLELEENKVTVIPDKVVIQNPEDTWQIWSWLTNLFN